MFLKITLSTVAACALSYAFILISKRIGYEYGSKKREILSVVLTGIYVLLISYFSRKSFSFTVQHEMYFPLFLIAAVISISSSFIDLKYQEIPDSYNLATVGLGLVSVVLFPKLVNSAILIGGIMFGIYFLILIITGAMGGGDVKMAGALGTLIPTSMLGTFLISPFAVGSVIALYLLIVKKQNKNLKIPFGPYITIGYLITIFRFWAL
ncbi:MAG: prepilin peptidase [Tissierellia bacterium]|jgi:prepilin signal peptidase PulO-like enzyme (type II secretory pathway)|nr:prepilin peptidase [Tissierellia bacterium]